jgi:plasmid stabilization system protein ParE
MTYQVVIQPRAERDIQLAARWILGQSGSPATALRWARNLRAQIATPKTSPLRCPIDQDSEVYGEEVRVLLHGDRSALPSGAKGRIVCGRCK